MQPRALASAPPPAKAGGGWEGVASDPVQLSTGIARAHATPPQPSPASAGEGAFAGAASAASSAPALHPTTPRSTNPHCPPRPPRDPPSPTTNGSAPCREKEC